MLINLAQGITTLLMLVITKETWKQMNWMKNLRIKEDEDNKVHGGLQTVPVAFKSIIRRPASDDVLGPIISGQKKLVAQKLGEEESGKAQNAQKGLNPSSSKDARGFEIHSLS